MRASGLSLAKRNVPFEVRLLAQQTVGEASPDLGPEQHRSA